MKRDPEIEKGISDIVGVFTDPIIVFPGGWGDTLPDWLKESITLERLIGNIKALTGEEPTATDAEVCAYLYTASLTQPLDSDWVEIYLYIATTVYGKFRTKDSGVTVPADIRVETISDYRMGLLNDLKRRLYERRIRVRKDTLAQERREERGKTKKAAPAVIQHAFDLGL